MNEINVPIQEEVDNTKVLDDSAEKLATIATKLSEIFTAGFDAGFIGGKTNALLEAYKQDVKDYIDGQLDYLLTGESADGVLNTIQEISNALNGDAQAFTTLMNKIAEAKSTASAAQTTADNAVKSVKSSATSTLRLYACVNDNSNYGVTGDGVVTPQHLGGETNAASTVEISSDTGKKYKNSVMIRDKNGRSSVMNPRYPKNIANKEYVDGEVESVKSSVDATNTKITNMLTSSLPEHRVTYASYAYKSPYLVYPSYDDALMSKKHVEAKIATEISKVINGAPEALDTLLEISEALNNDADAVASLTKAIADNKVAAEKYADDMVGSVLETIWGGGTLGLAYRLNPSSGNIIITGIGSAKDSNITISEYILGLPVAEIGDEAFSYGSLSYVDFGNSVERIGLAAFANCSYLGSIKLGDGVRVIGANAFFGCENLNYVTIPDGVTDIGKLAFSGCKSLTSITIPNSVTGIYPNAFEGCTSLNSVTIGSGLTVIFRGVFSGCVALKNVYIPKSIINIEEGAFKNCTNLMHVYYAGSQSEWEAITKGSDNGNLSAAIMHYNYYNL